MPTHLSKRLVNWASVLEPKTEAQAQATASMPFIYPHLALMPDAHLGKGATVGSVIPTLRAIIPAAVGVDIGCGMIAVRTPFTRTDLASRDLRILRESIERAVPLSAGKYNTELTDTARVRVAALEARAEIDYDSYAGNWRLQLGTLGSGNHFLEVTVDEQDRVWAFLHSGSRGAGNRIAQRHIAVARKLCERWWVELPDRDLAYLVEGTDEFWACLGGWMDADVQEQERINCHHNFTQREKHFGKEVWVSRKGAIEARAGQPGLIPGSMGTASYVVVGKGDPLSLNSSPHGAGRQYSRSAARRQFTVADLRTALVGIEYRDTDAFVDEIPGAYKDIDQVMADAADLVEIRHTLRQVVNVKGD